MKRPSFFAALLVISLFLSGCSDRHAYRQVRFLMGTTAEFNIVSGKKNPSKIKQISALAESRIAGLDRMLSIFKDSSEVSVINSAVDKKSVNVSAELFKLVEKAKEYFALTQGAFDITVGPLTEIWGFGRIERTMPDERTIKEALKYTGLDKVGLDGQNKALIFNDPRTMMDFGGFAKGYAVDEAVKIFRENGVTDGLVNLGGDLYCMGKNRKGEDWAIGVRDPENKNKNLAVLIVSNKAIATSGDYENFYIDNDRRYAHIIDPRSGDTVSNGIESVTIIADDCASADALATAVFVLGKRDGTGLIEKLPGIECLIVAAGEKGMEIVSSSGMKKFIKR